MTVRQKRRSLINWLISRCWTSGRNMPEEAWVFPCWVQHVTDVFYICYVLNYCSLEGGNWGETDKSRTNSGSQRAGRWSMMTARTIDCISVCLLISVGWKAREQWHFHDFMQSLGRWRRGGGRRMQLAFGIGWIVLLHSAAKKETERKRIVRKERR